MGEIEEGMEVLIPDGGTAQVNGVFPRGKRDVYEVVTVDGARTQACDEHLWEVLIYD